PSLKIGDFGNEKRRVAANKRFQDWLTAIKDRIGKVGTVAGGALGGPFGLFGGRAALRAIVESKVKPWRGIFDILLASKTQDVDETGALSGTLPGFPDLSATFTSW